MAHARKVTYRGVTFSIPASWQVINLAAHPRQCVRFDRHVLYLGRPGADQRCPAALIGTTEAMLVQPSASRSGVRAAAYPVDRLIIVATRRITVTATYGADRALVNRILASASLPAPAGQGQPGSPPSNVPGALAAGPAARASLPGSATSYTGQGFDACTAPDVAQMQTWLRLSPYRAVGIYIGGSDRACAQPNLTSSWVTQLQQEGWHFIPIYVGPQASFGEITSAASQAVSAAQDAVSQARQLGFGPGSPIYYDMENFPGSLDTQVLRFATAWTEELHLLGYRSGFYSNSNSGIADLVQNYANTAYIMPDIIYDALWNDAANTSDPSLPATDWPDHQRIHQYLGGQNVTYGGDTINIDQDYLDVQLPGGGSGDTGGSRQASQAAAQPGGAVTAFYRGTNGQLWRDSFTPGIGWQGPASMGGSLASQPAAVQSSPGTTAVFARGSDGHLWEAVSGSGSGWSSLAQLNVGKLGSRPAAVARSSGVIDVFWRGSADKHLWHAEYNPGKGWGKPQDLGGQLVSVPAPAVSGAGTLSVFWKGADGHLWQIRRNPGQSWAKAASLGMGMLGGGPVAAGLADGTIDVFWPGSSRARVWGTRYVPGTGWSVATAVGGIVTGGPFVVTAGQAADVFWRGSGGKLWWSTSQGAGWQQSSQLGMGVLGGAPFAAGQAGGAVDVFWKGSADRHLWHARYRAGSWSGPGDLGGAVS